MSRTPLQLLKRAGLAGVALIIHTGLIGVAIGTVYVTERWIHYLWSDTDPLLFDKVPYRYLFQVLDFGFIALFGGMGVHDAYHILGGKE